MNRAILVREKVTRLVKMLVEKQIKVTQRGSRAYVEYSRDGRPSVVNIPYIPDDASEEFLAATEGFLDHEVAHVLFTDYSALARARKGGVANLHNIIEDAFIEKKMAAQFAGSGLNLKNVGEFFLKTYTSVNLESNPENAVGLLMVPAIRALSGQVVYIDYMADKWHHLDSVMTKIKGYAEVALSNITCSEDGVDVALEIKKLLDAPDEKDDKSEGEPEKSKDASEKSGKGGKPKGKPESEDEIEPEDESEGEPEGDSEDDSEDDFEGEPEGGPEDGDDSEGDLDLDGEPEGDSAGDDPEGVDGSDLEEKNEDRATAEDKEAMKTPSSKEVEDAIGDKDFDAALSEVLSAAARKEAKEADYLIYSKELDVVELMKVGERDGYSDAMLTTMQDRVDHMVGPLQKDLERAISARSASSWSAGHRSGRLHSSALARLTAFSDDRAFRRKHVNTTKDVAVSLLIDCSGSMSGSKIKTAAYAAYGLSSVLDRMSISHEVLGFTTSGGMPPGMAAERVTHRLSYAREQSLYIPILKPFSERLGSECKKRFAALPEAYWLSENVDGESVQIAATRLLQRPETRKILIVLSDGQPACPGNVTALRRHLQKTVMEVTRQGVDVLGLGIESDAPKGYYPKHVILNELSELPTTVIGEIKRLLMKA